MEIKIFEYLKNEKSFLDEIKKIFHSFWGAIIWWKIKILRNSGHKLYPNQPYFSTWPKNLKTNILRRNELHLKRWSKAVFIIFKGFHWSKQNKVFLQGRGPTLKGLKVLFQKGYFEENKIHRKFKPMFHFYTPWKRQAFSGDIEMEPVPVC